jgi:membrane-associated phospholipid phosphatase
MSESLRQKRKASRRVPAILVGGFAASVVSIVLFGKVSDEVLEHETMSFDTRVIEEVREMRDPALDRVMLAITATGEPWALSLVTGLVGLRWLRESRRADIATLLLATAGGSVVNQLLKRLFKRDRPAIKLRRAHASGSSYPSGHAMTTLAAYGTVAYLVSRRGALTHRPGAALVWVPVLALCVLVGSSRVYLEVHYPTDVIGAWAVGTIWLTTCGIARGFMEPEES